MLKLHTIKMHPKSTHRRKVVGRGLGSGKGTYSTRGGKGQTARTGHSKMPVGFEGGRQPLIRQLPKNRGFRSPREDATAIRLDKLAKAFPEGGTITITELKAKKLIASSVFKVKIVGTGKVIAKLDVKVPASKAVQETIKAAGGTVK
jgi:large subunit ribosomal protein L15